MTEHKEKEYIHWQDLAEQLGADPASEINDYFGGTANFINVELDESELPDTLPVPTETVEMTNENEIEAEADEAIEIRSEASMPTESVAERTPSETDLEIGWTAPDPTPAKPAAAREASKSDKPARAKKRTPAKKPAKKPPQETPAANSGHWNSLASTLGLASPESDESVSEETATVAESSFKIEEPLEFEGFGDDIIDEPKSKSKSKSKSMPKSRPKSRPKAEPPRASTPVAESSGFGAGIIDLGEVEKSEDEIAPMDILDEMFVASDEPFVEDEDDDDPDDLDYSVVEFDDSPAVADESAEVVETTDADGDYVEFEVEDLDPGGSRPRGRRKPSRERVRPERGRRESREETPKERSGKARKPRERDEADSEERSGKARKPRERDEADSEERPSDDRPKRKRKRRSERTEEVAEERPRKRRGRRSRTDSEETTETTSVPDDDPSLDLDDDTEETADGRDSSSRKPSGKAKKLPTWADTIDVVVEANISSRKKPPRKKRGGGGRSRRGGRDRERSN